MNNRELVSFILMGTFLLAIMLPTSTRSSMVDVAKAFATWKVAVPFLLLVGNVVGAVWVAHGLGLWTTDLVAATVLWFIFVGFVWLMNLGSAGKEPGFIKHRLVEAVGAGVALEAFVNLKTLSIPLEFVLQVLLTFFVVMEIAASRKPETAGAGPFFRGVVALTGVGLIAYTAFGLARDWSELDKSLIRNEFLLPVWLTGSVVPFMFVLAVLAGWELVAVRMRFANQRRRPKLRVLAGVLAELRGSLVDAGLFGHPYTRYAVESGTFAGGREAVRRLRADRVKDERDRAAAQARLLANAGRKGSDAEGRLLDRREFAETKAALEWLSNAHMGWYRNRSNVYRDDLLDLLTDVKIIDLPDEPPMVMSVRNDGQAWSAYRATPSGHVFGMGADGPPPSKWYYDGPGSPTDYPPGPGWSSFMDETRKEWLDEDAT